MTPRAVSYWYVHEAPGTGDSGAGTQPPPFDAFFEAEYPRLFGTMYLATGDGSESDDVVQEAFLQVWLRWDRVGSLGSPTSYLYRTAFNVAKNRLRSAKRATRRLIPSVDHLDPTTSVDDRTVVMAALGTLPRRARMAVVLTDLLGYTSEEVGQALGIGASTARSLATRGRAQLRQQIGDVDG